MSDISRAVALTADRHQPDRFAGVTIMIDRGRNVTVKSLPVGDKTGIVARRVTRLRLLDHDLSHNWKPRLYSGIIKESLIDWLDLLRRRHGALPFVGQHDRAPPRLVGSSFGARSRGPWVARSLTRSLRPG